MPCVRFMVEGCAVMSVRGMLDEREADEEPAHGRTDRAVGGGVGGTVCHAPGVAGPRARCVAGGTPEVTLGS